MSAPQEVIRLVETFRNNIESFKSGNYNETQVRREFIDPFFDALGWDVFNKSGYAEAYKDVIHEYSQKTTDTTKNPDYCFRIGGKRKFFVEAKKPSVNLKDNIHPAYQLRRYGWSAKLPLSILTDFEEFAVYDCRVTPKKNDKASTARIMFLTYEDYIDKWDELIGIFSKDAILKGSFDKYAESNKKKRGTADVDEAFLKEMEEWRNLLARNIALRNSNLSIRELNYSVQKTIDRIIFLRICEDRGIENYGQLMNLLNGTNVYERLKQIFTRADEKYNSGLFHFEKEKDRNDPPDEITPLLLIDDKTLKDIIKKLYYPESPYEFSVLPADILGHVYEQFLGKVIRLTPAHYAVVEDKPEVKKAGGVYYTPTYIVDYIVKNTVGKILEKKTPKQVENISILDPACGSGSFLLGAYQYLLDWHLKYYIENTKQIDVLLKKKKPPIYQIRKNEYLLTTTERKRILLNNIYGVDIDSQAVEVTKLSLLLKVLEGESEETLTNQMRMFRERALPDLANNIKCGNSLICPDFYEQMEMNFLDDEEKLKINVFDWETEFKEIMESGGFDVVIGNPPYVRIQGRSENETKYFNEKYKAATGNYDIYCLFIEKNLTLLTNNGLCALIVAHRFFKVDYGVGIRDIISKKNVLNKVIDFDGFMVFPKASINTSIIILSKKSSTKYFYQRIIKSNLSAIEVDNEISTNSKSFAQFKHSEYDWLSINDLSKDPWMFILNNQKNLWKKLNTNKLKLKDIATNIFQGLKTGSDGYFIAKVVGENKNYYNCYFPGPDKRVLIEKNVMHPLIKGGNIKRYQILGTDRKILFPYKDGKLISSNKFKEEFPKAWNYLISQKDFLSNRERGKMKNKGWYAYTRSQALENIFLKKIITPEYYANASYALDNKGDFMFCGGGAGGYAISLKKKYSYEIILALLNSKLLDWYLRKISMRAYQTAYMYTKKYISQLPISVGLFFGNKAITLSNKIKSLSIQNISLVTRLKIAKTPTEQTALQRQIDATDKQIDKLVYQLYGLTEKEIKIVEES